MALNILIVDDSSFFQRQLKNIINEHPELNVIGIADNGREAIEKVKSLKPDIVTMDYEMPMMDGVTAVRTIMAENPLPIMMLSSMTYEGARTTLDALDAGAVDFMTKNFSEIANNSPAIKKRIYDALLAIGKKSNKQTTTIAENTSTANIEAKQQNTLSSTSSARAQATTANTTPVTDISHVRKPINQVSRTAIKPKLIVIGASTGGPAALTELIKGLPSTFSLPILIVQHMPENFTRAFAERLDRQTHLNVKEAETGDIIRPGQVLLAPGGKQMIVDSQNKQRVKIIEGSSDVNYTPCVDISFASLANMYGKDVLAIVMTGMGQDGCKGARLLKEQGASIWTQAKEDCLIYGMPMAVDQANLSMASYTVSQLQKEMAAIGQ